MKVVVVGAGAMGSVYAALLAEAGHEVWAVDAWAEHVDRINATGLRLEGASGDRVIRLIRATTRIEDVGVCDLCIIATKASAVGIVAQGLAPVIGPDALVLTIQNGLGAGDRIAQYMPTQNVLLGVADGFGASLKGPGHAFHSAMKLIRLGEIQGGLTTRLKRLEVLWQEAGFKARAFADIHQLIWEKFLCNVTLSAPCTVFDCTVGELMNDPEHWAVAMGCMQEAYAAGMAEGIQFSFEDPIAYVSNFAAMLQSASPSMRQDHLARRASEIDAINGMVPIMGARHGIATPYNSTLSAVVRAREAEFIKENR